MSKTMKKESVNEKLVREVKKFKEKAENRKEQVGRLKHIIRELEKEKQGLIEKLKAYESGIEYKPKDINKPKKLTKEEKEVKQKEAKVNEKDELKKRLKEKFGRKGE